MLGVGPVPTYTDVRCATELRNVDANRPFELTRSPAVAKVGPTVLVASCD